MQAIHYLVPNIDTGDGVRLDIGKHLTSGVGILLDTNDGNQMTQGALMFVNGIKQKWNLLHINASVIGWICSYTRYTFVNQHRYVIHQLLQHPMDTWMGLSV